MKHSKVINVAAIIAFLCIGALPRYSYAGLTDLVARAVAWWHLKSVAYVSEGPYESRQEAEDDGNEPREDNDKPPASRVAGMCAIPREPPAMICEIGSGFLCVDTPPGGVDAESFILHGTIDRRGSVFASFHVVVQNEYTKQLTVIDTLHPAGDNCRGELASAVNFCLDAQGYFAARVPLLAKGPHTISISASRLSGESIEKRVRTSKVVPLTLDSKQLFFDPDITKGGSVDASSVMVSTNLLGQCQFCDFIGASTGGVRVTVENRIKDAAGTIKNVSCPTTAPQGGSGSFVVGVPTLPGENNITVTACNAATEGDCPTVRVASFIVKGSADSFEIIFPEPAPSYDAKNFPTIPWIFSLGGSDASCVQMQFNREAPKEMCPSSDGTYSTELSPRRGINVAAILQEGVEKYAWTFGWGDILSPYANDGKIDVKDAARIAIPARTITKIAMPIINNFLASDELGGVFQKLLGEKKEVAKNEAPPASTHIPKCNVSDGLGGFAVAMRGIPVIAAGRIDNITFDEGRIIAKLAFDGVKIGLSLSPDENSDGEPDLEPLPLLIAFKKLVAEIIFEGKKDEGGRPIFILGSPYDDCNFKDDSYCTKMPAILVPRNFIGGANEYGGFVSCEVDKAKGEARYACKAINSTNAQTGLVSEKILDAINSAIYCGGSLAFTSALQKGITFDDVKLGCSKDEECEGMLKQLLAPTALPFSLVINDGVHISSSGLLVDAGVSVGKKNLYDGTPKQYKILQSGIVADTSVDSLPPPSLATISSDVAASLSLDAINALLFAATHQGDGVSSRGLLDFDIDTDLFEKLGFDFVEQCDKFVPIPGEKEAPPTACYVRPRVNELLGSSLTTYGYFLANQPLLLAIRGNRALPPRLAARKLDDIPVVIRAEAGKEGEGEMEIPTGNLLELELGGVLLSFYALELDKSKPVDGFGNLPIKRDANGRPIIKTMHPEDPNPMNGPIVSFDLTLLLGIEISAIEPDLTDPAKGFAAIRLLSDRSRLVIVPIAGSNATTVPASGLVSSLAEKLRLAISGMSSHDTAVKMSIPLEIALSDSSDNSLMAGLGLRSIDFGDDGLSFVTDPATNSIEMAIKAVVTQVLHEKGEEVRYIVPKR